MESTLIIKGIGFPRLSCREVTQTLLPIQQGEIRRSVNGELCYIGTSAHHKYKSTIMCADYNLPGLQQVWVGAQVSVLCVSDLWERFVLGDETVRELSRPPVPGSLNGIRADGSPIEAVCEESLLTLPQGDGEEVMVSYRPLLKMRITAFDFRASEWEKGAQWRLLLEEV